MKRKAFIVCCVLVLNILSLQLSLNPSVAADYSSIDNYCDFYDDYSSMLVSFPKGSKLRRPNFSATGGVGIDLPDGTAVGIAPDLANEDFDVCERESRLRDSWAERYLDGNECKLVPIDGKAMRRISCRDSDHIFLYKRAHKGSISDNYDKYIYINHEFENSSMSKYYRELIESIRLFYGDIGDKAYDINKKFRTEVGDMSNGFCGKFRIRSLMLAGRKNKNDILKFVFQ